MNQQIWCGLAAALLVMTAGTSPSKAVQDEATEPASKTEINLKASPVPSPTSSSKVESSSSKIKVQKTQPTSSPKVKSSSKVKARKTQSKTGPRLSRRSGTASWYGPGFHGRRTASGERFNSYGLTAAHRSLPFGTRVRVTNARTGRSVVVRINDRGPYSRGRVIDLSRGAARVLGVSGTAPVRLDIIK